MKSRNLLFSLTAIALIGFAVILSAKGPVEMRTYHPRKTVVENGIQGALEWLGNIRNNRLTGTVSLEDVLNAKKQISELTNHKALGIGWNELGPNNVGGRVRAILIDKDNHNLLYAGSVSGGLWKSTTGGSSWVSVSSFPDLNIACIAQNPISGALYVGTGESFANVGGAYGTPGFIGSGLYESIDGGNTWAIYNGATPTTLNVTNDTWAFVNKIAFDPSTGRLYAATKKGLRFWDGSAWINPVYLVGTTPNQSNCNTVVVGSDRKVVAVVGNKVYISPAGTGNGDDHTFVDKSPATGLGRTEVTIAASNPDYIYTCSANSAGALKGIYRSIDGGTNWTLIGPGGAPAFNLFGDNGQGGYDNVISVSPFDPNMVIVGGINTWQYTLGGNFTQLTAGFEVHVDIHSIVFDPVDPYTFYVGCDGGLYKTTDLGAHWLAINKNLNVTQFYSIANSKTGEVMAGTQDNSNPYISRSGSDPKSALVLYGGDGGWAAFSAINPDVFFGTMQYGGTWRSPDKGETYQSAIDNLFFSPTMIGSSSPGFTPDFGPFVTPMLHWESFSDYYSLDSVIFKDTIDYHTGDVAMVKSKNNYFPFQYVFTSNMNSGDSVKVQDIISSKFFVALGSGIWMTKRALDFSSTPKWIKICNVGVQTMAISNDGNYIFAGTTTGILYRISNILAVKDSVTGTVGLTYSVIEQKIIESWSGRSITAIAVDPTDPSRVVVTLGDYGETDYVYLSTNALDSNPAFTSKQGTTVGKKLPAMPVYSCLIEMFGEGKRVLVGTEYGIYAIEDITKSPTLLEWTEENTGMARVPVFGIRQQTLMVPGMGNTLGMIYIGTHGRGFFESDKYLDITSVPETDFTPSLSKPTLNIYPNPVVNITNVNFTLPLASEVVVNIFDLNGRLVKITDMSRMTSGTHNTSIDCSMLERGTYILQLLSGKESTTIKFVITK